LERRSAFYGANHSHPIVTLRGGNVLSDKEYFSHGDNECFTFERDIFCFSEYFSHGDNECFTFKRERDFLFLTSTLFTSIKSASRFTTVGSRTIESRLTSQTTSVK